MRAMNIVNVGYDSTNYYLLGNSGTQLLVDTGWPGTLPKLLSVCRKKGVALEAIRYLLATHYHPDHAGLAQELKQKGVKLIVMQNQLASIPILGTYIKPEQHYVEIELGDNLNLQARDSREFLGRLGFNGEIIETPGHSEDSVTLILDEGLAFTGDLTHPMLAEDPHGQVMQSWERIRLLHARMIHPGHGPVWEL